jgi:integrase
MPKKRNAEWEYGLLKSKVYIGDGKYKYLYAKTQKDLDDKVLGAKIALNKGLDLACANNTFGEWAEIWLQNKSGEVSAARYVAYKCELGNFLDFYPYHISKIRQIDIKSRFTQLSKTYANATLRDARNALNQIFTLAIDNRVLDFNPISSLKLPVGKSAEKRRAITDEERSWIDTTEHRGQTAAMIMMYAGLRRGEVIPLLWSDIDLDKGVIHVNKSVEKVGSELLLKEGAKTAAGVRSVFIPDILIKYLRGKLDLSTSEYVCPAANGNGMLTESGWRRMWESYLTALNFEHGDFENTYITDKNGDIHEFTKPESIHNPKAIPFVIDKITPHTLRHSYITMLYISGVDVLTAKEQAGHADIETTLNIYTHLDSTYKRKQIDKLNVFINSQKSSA